MTTLWWKMVSYKLIELPSKLEQYHCILEKGNTIISARCISWTNKCPINVGRLSKENVIWNRGGLPQKVQTAKTHRKIEKGRRSFDDAEREMPHYIKRTNEEEMRVSWVYFTLWQKYCVVASVLRITKNECLTHSYLYLLEYNYNIIMITRNYSYTNLISVMQIDEWIIRVSYTKKLYFNIYIYHF